MDLAVTAALQNMLKRRLILSAGWSRRVTFHEDLGSDKRPVPPLRVVPERDARSGGGTQAQEGQAAPRLRERGHQGDILSMALMPVSLQQRVV